MTSSHRTRIGLAAALAMASLASATPAGADPNPPQRLASSPRAAALAQERYYMSHKPAIPAPGHAFNTIDARPSSEAPVTADAPSSSGFQWGDAAIGAGSALTLALVFAGGVVAITRRRGLRVAYRLGR